MGCVHRRGPASTLRTVILPISEENPETMFAMTCSECGKWTWPYYSVKEAILQAEHEQWSLYSQKED